MSDLLNKQISDWVKGLNFREVVFALEVINIMFNIDIHLKPENGYLLEVLKNHITCEEDLHDLKYNVTRDLVSNEWVDWVLQNRRHGLWFVNYQRIFYMHFLDKHDISPDYFKDLICNIDLHYWQDSTRQVDFDVKYKTDIYSKAKEGYENALKYLKDFNWIKKDDEDLLDWCLDYLDNKHLLLRYGLTYPDSSADKYDVIMVSIQLNECRRCSRRYQPIKDKMHKAWIQKKWRDKKDAETALEHILSKKQFVKMLEIADKHNSKPIDLLNNWIDAEYKNLD